MTVITNTDRPTTTITNTTRVPSGETWAIITTTWAAETRTWAESGSFITPTARPTTVITNLDKPS
jgi:hypothetical protein